MGGGDGVTEKPWKPGDAMPEAALLCLGYVRRCDCDVCRHRDSGIVRVLMEKDACYGRCGYGDQILGRENDQRDDCE